MPAQIFGAAAAVSILNRAFANTSPAYAAYSNQVEAAKASLKAGDNANNALSYLSFAKDFGAAYAAQTPEALSTLLLTNIGVLPSTDDSVKALEPALVDYIKANGVQNIGIIALQLGNIFTTLENGTGDLAVYNAAAVAWNNEVTAAQAYSSNAANTVPQVGEQAVDGGENGIPLTNKTDKLSGNKFSASQVYTPGGDDRINSLQDEDVLTGTGTKPTLNADLGNANDNGATIITPKLVNIEVANLKFTGSGAAVVALDVQDATGLKEVNIERVSQASNMARVENIKQVLTNMSIASTNANNTGAVEFSFGAGTLAGDNTAAVKVDNVQIGTVNIGANTSGVGAAGVGNQGYETINLESAGASNAIGTLNLPMDTGTAGKVTITGDKNLTLAATTSVRNAVTNAVESTTYAGGIAQANGRLATVDATALTGNLTLNVGAGFLTTGKADTSGVVQNVSVLLGKGNDVVVLSDQVQAGDSLSAGEGTDTLVLATGAVVNSSSSVLTGFENVEVRAAGGGAIAADFDKLPDTKLALVRNEGAAGAVPAAQTLTTTLTNLTVVQAAALNILHSNTGSNAITQNVLSANLKTATGTTDAVVLSINEGSNTDPRFNFTLQTQNAAGVTGGVENLTLTNNDSESNTVALGTSGQHTGTVTTTSSGNAAAAGTFLNLDTTAAGANGGLYQYAVTGAADATSSAAGATVMRLADHSGTAGQVRINAATFDASADAANIIVRMGNNAASVVGAQTVKTGAGNDTVIFDNLTFDNLGDTRAGLTISDTVSGGAGTDTIALDGNVQITLGASEWTNVSGFEIIRLIGNGVAANNLNATSNSYNLVLTDAMLAANKDATTGALQIIADNDLFNNTGRTTAVAAAAAVEGVPVANNVPALASGGLSLDARTVSAGSKWSFKGNEGDAVLAGNPGQSADRIILSDKNIDGNATIDGGALDNITDNRGLATTSIPGNAIIANQGNADVIEVRNQAEVTLGDLANIRNIGTLSFTNDLAITQVSKLQLNDTVVDALVDSFQTSVSRTATTGANVEVLVVNAIDNMNVAAATTGLTIEGGALTNRSDVNVTLGRGANNVQLGGGMDRVVVLGNYTAGQYPGGVGNLVNGVDINAQNTGTNAIRNATDNFNLGAGFDTLVTYGAVNFVNLAGFQGIELIVPNSALVITTAQWASLVAANPAGPVIRFEGNQGHQLTIVDNTAGADAIDLSLIAVTGGSLTYDVGNVVGAGGGGAVTVTNAPVVSGTGTIALPGNVGTAPTNNPTPITATIVTAGTTVNQTAAAENFIESGTGNSTVVITQASASGTFGGFEAGDTLKVNTNTTLQNANAGLALGFTTLDLTAAGAQTVNLTAAQLAGFSVINNAGGDVLTVTDKATTFNTATGLGTLAAIGLVEGSTLTVGTSAADLALNVTESGGAAVVTTVNLGAGAYTGTYTAFDSTDVIRVVNSTNLSSVTGLNDVVIDLQNAAATVILNGSQNGTVTFTNTTGNETIALSAADTFQTVTGINNYTLAGVNGSVVTLKNGDVTINGTGAFKDTVNTGTLTSFTNTTLNLGAGADILTISTAGTDISGLTITGIETVNLPATSTMTQAQFTGFTTVNAPATETVTFKGAVAALNLGAAVDDPVDTFVFSDSGNDTATVTTGGAATTFNGLIDLSGGGSDMITITNAAITAADTINFTVKNFNAAGVDRIVSLGTPSTFQTVTTANTALTVSNNGVVVVNTSVGELLTPTNDNAGAVENLIALAFGTAPAALADGNDLTVVCYGGGNAYIYQVDVTTKANFGSDTLATNAAATVVELVATLTGVAPNSLTSANFI